MFLQSVKICFYAFLLPIIQYSKSRLKTKAQPESLVWNLLVLFKSKFRYLSTTNIHIFKKLIILYFKCRYIYLLKAYIFMSLDKTLYLWGIMSSTCSTNPPEHVEDARKVVRVSKHLRSLQWWWWFRQITCQRNIQEGPRVQIRHTAQESSEKNIFWYFPVTMFLSPASFIITWSIVDARMSLPSLDNVC